MADAAVMEGSELKENVNPVEGRLWGQSRRKLRLGKGVSVGAPDLRSREKSGVLAPNTTLGNGGDVDAMEWLKDHLSKMDSELDLGRRHMHKVGIPVADSKVFGATGREPMSSVSHPSPCHSKASLLLSRNSVDQPERSVRNHRFSNGVQAIAKSKWRPKLRKIEIYQDGLVDSEDKPDTSRREVKEVETKSPVAQGTASISEIEQHPKVIQDSPTNAQDISKSRLQLRLLDGKKPSPWQASRGSGSSGNSEDQPDTNRREEKEVETKFPGAVNSVAQGIASTSEIEQHSKVIQDSLTNAADTSKSLQLRLLDWKKPSLLQASPGTGSGLWSGSKRQGTPYKTTVLKSCNSAGQSDRTITDQQFSSGGQAVRSKSQWPANVRKPETRNAKSSVTSQDLGEANRREVQMEAVEKKSSSDGGTDYRKLAPRLQLDQKGTQSSDSTCEELKSRIQQHHTSFLNNLDSARSSFAKRQGPLDHHGSSLPEEEGAAIRFLCERKNSEEVLPQDQKDYVVSLAVPEDCPRLQLQIGIVLKLDSQIDYGSRASIVEEISRHADCQSEDRAKNVVSAGGPSPPPAETQSEPTIRPVVDTSKCSRSSGVCILAEAHYSPSGHVLEDDLSKWNSSNIDMTAVGHGSALLSSEMTGTSSSGSSSTACLMGNSTSDDDTVKSRESVLPTSSVENSLSYRLSADARKLSRIKKCSRSLGPPSRVLRNDVLEAFNSRISPVTGPPVIESDCSALTTEEVIRNVEQLGYPLSDPKKRKAETDPSSGDGDRSQIIELSTCALDSLQKDIEVAVQGQQQHPWKSPELPSMSKENPGQLANNLGRPRLPTKQVSESKKSQPTVSRKEMLAYSGTSSKSLPITFKSKTGECSARQCSSTPAQSCNELGVFEGPKDSSYRSDGSRAPGGDISRMQPLSNGAAGTSVTVPVSKPGSAVEVCEVSNERSGREQLCTEPFDQKEGNELAVDMSHDGFSSEESLKENVPIRVVPDLSNCVGSLFVGAKDMLKKDQKRLPVPSDAPLNQLSELKGFEHSGAPHSASRPSSVSTIQDAHNEIRTSPHRSGQKQRNESDGNQVRSSLISDNLQVGKSNKAVGFPLPEYRAVPKTRSVPSETAQNSGARAQQQSSHGTTKEIRQKGASASSQTKMSENSHFVWVNNKRYRELGKIGKGGSSEVYKVIDSDYNIYALKKINLKGRELSVARGFYQEIEYLERFLGKRNVIQLIDYEVTNRTVIRDDYAEDKIVEDACIYMVLEFGEIDLAGILIKKRKEMIENNEIIDGNWLRFYWKHMLLAVKTIHDERIVHADLKPANFLLVKGELKLIDFGIAKAIQNDTTHIVRDSQVGTLNYMSPEAFMTNSVDEEGRMVKCGRASDIWSLGCILYQMVYGHTPFSQVDSFYAKITAITSKNHKIEFPAIPDPWLQDVMKKCLTWDRYSRPDIVDLLQHPIFTP